MAVSTHVEFDNHESVLFCHDRSSDLRAIIAVHNTNRGPAIGGCRMWPYASEDDALTDVLRLSKGMSYKNAVVGLPHGGGKSVIIGDPKSGKSPALFEAFGRFVDQLGGTYIVAEDVGTSVSDMASVARSTPFVAGLSANISGGGDPSPFTAEGVFLAIQEAVHFRRGGRDLTGISVIVQGLGHVGVSLCQKLYEAGAKLFVADIDDQRAVSVAARFAALKVAPDEVYDCKADIYAPCALGATLNPENIKRLKVDIVAGSANNQLADDHCADLLRTRKILYLPDFVINSGGVINVASEVSGHYSKSHVDKALRAIPEVVREIISQAAREDRSPNAVALDLAIKRLSDKSDLLTFDAKESSRTALQTALG